jgi:hypothetical protein
MTILTRGADRLLELHAAELPQKDELCGCFWTLLALRLAGVDVADQDAVALAAGSGLAPVDSDHSASLPRGEVGRRDYRLDLPVVDDPELSGTAPQGLIRAFDELSGGELAAVPVAGPWIGQTVSALLELAAGEPDAVLLLNVATRFFWGSRPPLTTLLAYLDEGDAVTGPEPDWDVGHFVGCLGAVRGAAGTLAIVGDTYPSLGVGGVHAQPVERVAAALERRGMESHGGVLVVVPASRREPVERRLLEGTFVIAPWDNGSRDMR